MQWQRFLPNTHTFFVCMQILHAVTSELYKHVIITECTQDPIHDVTMLAPAGTLSVNFTKDQLLRRRDCSLAFTVTQGNKLSLTFPDDLNFPWQYSVASVDGETHRNCSGGYLELFDPIYGQPLGQDARLCGRQLSTRHWKSFFTRGAMLSLKIVTEDDNFNGSVRFDVDYTSFKNESRGTSSDCHLCEQLTGATHTAVCIDPRLKCDGITNCPNGYASDEDYRYNSDPMCRFRCGSRSSKSIDPRKLCDGRVDCPNGSDEQKDMCKYTETTGPFGPLSLADGVVTIICGVILIILFTICLYCCCCPPPPEQKKILYSSNINLNHHDYVTSSTVDGPSRAPHAANSRDHNDLRVSSL